MSYICYVLVVNQQKQNNKLLFYFDIILFKDTLRFTWRGTPTQLF